MHNAVRPTTVVHEILGDKMVDTYAGPFEGAKKIKAKDWQPFIPIMPHGELSWRECYKIHSNQL